MEGGAAPKTDAASVSASRWPRFRFRPALPAGGARCLSRPVSLLLGLLGLFVEKKDVIFSRSSDGAEERPLPPLLLIAPCSSSSYRRNKLHLRHRWGRVRGMFGTGTHPASGRSGQTRRPSPLARITRTNAKQRSPVYAATLLFSSSATHGGAL